MKNGKITIEIISKNRELLSICDDISRLIVEINNSIVVKKAERKLVFFCGLFCKIVNSYDAARLLIKYGHIQDSGAIIRSLMESIFVLKACMNDDNYFNNYYRTDIVDLNMFSKKQIHYIDDMERKHPGVDECLDDSLQEANSQIEAYGEVPGIRYKPESVANAAGLQSIYYSIYSLLSCMNVHPSLRSIFSRIEFDDAGYPTEFKIGPETDSADRMLLLLVQLMIVTLECMNRDCCVILSSRSLSRFSVSRGGSRG